jgi:hypothetical protein
MVWLYGTDLSHNPTNKNLILGTGRWVLGIGALGKWGIGEKAPEVSGIILPTEMRAKLSPCLPSAQAGKKNSKTIAPTLQRPSAPSSLRIAPNNSFFCYQIMRKLSNYTS